MGSRPTLFFDFDFFCKSNNAPCQIEPDRDERFVPAPKPEINPGADWDQATHSSVHLARPFYRSSLPTTWVSNCPGGEHQLTRPTM